MLCVRLLLRNMRELLVYSYTVCVCVFEFRGAEIHFSNMPQEKKENPPFNMY